MATFLEIKPEDEHRVIKAEIVMANENNEHNQGANDGGLGNLPPKEQAETRAILDELGKEQDTNPPKPDGDKPPEKKPDEKKPEEKKPDGSQPPKKPEDEARRDISLMPAWVHKRAQADWQKREEALQSELKALKDGKPPTPDAGKKNEQAPPSLDLDAEIKAFAEKEGISVEMATGIITLAAKKSGTLPPDITERLNKIDKLESDRAIEVETVKFSSDFDQFVLPLIKAEYGDNVPAQTIASLKDKVKELAYSPEFQKVPYAQIYKGWDDFRGVIAPMKKGSEDGRGGTIGADGKKSGENQGLDWESVHTWSEEVVRGLSDTDFDQYSQKMSEHEKQNKGK